LLPSQGGPGRAACAELAALAGQLGGLATARWLTVEALQEELRGPLEQLEQLL
jgi:hypothetical protein